MMETRGEDAFAFLEATGGVLDALHV